MLLGILFCSTFNPERKGREKGLNSFWLLLKKRSRYKMGRSLLQALYSETFNSKSVLLTSPTTRVTWDRDWIHTNYFKTIESLLPRGVRPLWPSRLTGLPVRGLCLTVSISNRPSRMASDLQCGWEGWHRACHSSVFIAITLLLFRLNFRINKTSKRLSKDAFI